MKPILPFVKYKIYTELQYDSGNDKWFYFTHTFCDAKDDSIVYAVVNAKMVVKESSGKTVRCSEVLSSNEFFRNYAVPSVNPN